MRAIVLEERKNHRRHGIPKDADIGSVEKPDIAETKRSEIDVICAKQLTARTGNNQRRQSFGGVGLGVRDK